VSVMDPDQPIITPTPVFPAPEEQPQTSGEQLVAEGLPERDSQERLDPDPTGPFELEDGTRVQVLPLKTRQTLRLFRIITRGGASLLEEMDLFGGNQDDFAQKLMALLVFAIPEAEDETVDFLRSMVEAPGPFDTAEAKLQAELSLTAALENPELDDLLSIIQVIVAREADDLRSLGNRIRKMFETMTKGGMLKTPPKV
jgi:hypothetical protein